MSKNRLSGITIFSLFIAQSSHSKKDVLREFIEVKMPNETIEKLFLAGRNLLEGAEQASFFGARCDWDGSIHCRRLLIFVYYHKLLI